MRRILSAVALAACASYRALPLEAPGNGGSPLALRYERTRFHLFSSSHDDARIEAVFASGTALVATVSQPVPGVFVSRDSGIGWTFTPLEDRFRDVVFDGALVVGRGAAGIHCSDDGGTTWQHFGQTPIDAVAASGGAIYAAGGGHLHVSRDCARTWTPLSPQIAGAWRARSIAAEGRNIYLSVRGAREKPADLTALLDGSSDAAVAALSIADGHGTQWPGPDGVWATHDGGTLWQRTSLPLDAWLMVLGTELWAVAADPMIEGAVLVRRSPALAAALDGQLRGARPEAAALRAAFRFPGRDELLRDVPAPIFRSSDEGVTWVRADRSFIALRMAVDRQRAAQPSFEGAPRSVPSSGSGHPATAAAPGTGGARRSHGRRGGRGGEGRTPQPERNARAISPEQFFALLDPVRLLTRFNAGRPLAAVAGDAVLYAYAPTRELWDSLADAAVAASDSEGEIATDLAAPAALKAPGAPFELLSSNDGGASWSSLAPGGFDPGTRHRVAAVAYPIGIAGAGPQAILVFGATAGGQPWRETWRWVP